MVIINEFTDSADKWRYIVEIEPGIEVMVKFNEKTESEIVFREVEKQINAD